MHTRTHLRTLAGSALAAATIVAGATGASAATTQTSTTGPSTSAGARPTTTAACDADAHWPGYVQGKPDGFDARDDGAYMWHNPKGGWGLRVSHPVLPGKANRVVFSGSITTAGQIGHVVRVRDEKNDIVKVTNSGHTLEFRFVNYGGVDGVDFTTTCTPGLRVGMRADNQVMPTRFVHLGDKDAHPGSNPFLIRRRDNDTGTTAPSSGANGIPAAGAPASGNSGSGNSGSGSSGSGASGSGTSGTGTGAGGSAS